jgi:hypothetical protein
MTHIVKFGSLALIGEHGSDDPGPVHEVLIDGRLHKERQGTQITWLKGRTKLPKRSTYKTKCPKLGPHKQLTPGVSPMGMSVLNL